MRILITGSRSWDSWETIAGAIADVVKSTGASKEDTVVVHGACPRGADMMAGAIASIWGTNVEEHPADWDRYGKSAGFKRNSHMVNLGADICLAFIKDNSKGASHTARLAEMAGIPTKVYRE